MAAVMMGRAGTRGTSLRREPLLASRSLFLQVNFVKKENLLVMLSMTLDSIGGRGKVSLS